MGAEQPDILGVLARCTGFQWDPGNAPKLAARHDVEPGECEQVFFREPFLVALDEKHSSSEHHWQALGHTLAGRKLFLPFTVRDDSIRVIAARDMNRKERRAYEKAQAELEENPGLRD